MLTNFEGIKHFSPVPSPFQNWGPDPSKLSRELLLKVDELRDAVNSPILVTSGYRPNDFGSQHALGLALDIIAPSVKLYDFYLAAEHLNFTGIGIYPHWTFKNDEVGGLHVDLRIGKPARWMGLGNDKGQQYIVLNSENLKKYGVV